MSRTSVARAALRSGSRSVMVRKLLARLTEQDTTSTATAWAARAAEDTASLCRSIDQDLWAEADAAAFAFEAAALARVREAGIGMGGGHIRLLHFLVRLTRPSVVVETGVAAGWTSQTILAAMERNGHGHLYSSDFPYFRHEGAEDAIGMLVEERLRARWTLGIEGDDLNLRRFLAEIDVIDLVHYDSDKSFAGRRRAMRLLTPRLAPDAIVVMDDINDNTYFAEHLAAGPRPVHVFANRDRFVGVVGDLGVAPTDRFPMRRRRS